MNIMSCLIQQIAANCEPKEARAVGTHAENLAALRRHIAEVDCTTIADVSDVLGVSHGTAARYLREIEQEDGLECFVYEKRKYYRLGKEPEQ